MERRNRERQEFVLSSEPQLRTVFRDVVTGAVGYLIIDTLAPAAAFAAVDMGRGIQWTALAPLARTSTVRYQLARVDLSGARIGIDYDEKAPDRLAVLERVLRALKPYLTSVLSFGPGVGVTTEDLDRVAAQIGLSSPTEAIARQQGWDEHANTRLAEALALPVGKDTLRDLRMPYYAARAVRAVAGVHLGDLPEPRVALLGLGRYARRLARQLRDVGFRIVAFANTEVGCHAPAGLSAEALDGIGDDGSIEPTREVELVTYHEALRVGYDVLVLASREPRLGVADVGKVGGRLVVEASQQAVTPQAEAVLIDRGVSVIPNFAVSLGAIVLTDAVRKNEVPCDAESLLNHLAARARASLLEICRLAEGTRISLRDAGLRVAFRRWERLPPLWQPQRRLELSSSTFERLPIDPEDG